MRRRLLQRVLPFGLVSAGGEGWDWLELRLRQWQVALGTRTGVPGIRKG